MHKKVIIGDFFLFLEKLINNIFAMLVALVTEEM